MDAPLDTNGCFSPVVAKFSHLDDRLKQMIVTMYRHNKPITEIADALGVSRNTVYLWIRRWKEEGCLGTRKPSGRPRKTTAFEDQQILQAYCPNLKLTEMARANKLSTTSLRRRLREAGLKTHKIPTPPKKKVRVRACANDVLTMLEQFREPLEQPLDLLQSNMVPSAEQQSNIRLQSDLTASNMGTLGPDSRNTNISEIGHLA